MSLWRVYLPEWLVVYTSDSLGVAGQEECEAVFDEKHRGRVRAEDWGVVPSLTRAARSPNWSGAYCLKLCLPNLQGEYKDRADAEALLEECGPDAFLVAQGSQEEQELLDYGKKMLKT